MNEKTFFILFSTAAILSALVVFLFYKPSLINLLNISDISELYNIRGEFREITSNVPSFARYVFSWSSKIVVPILLVYGLAKKNNIVILLALTFGLLLFSATGLKSIFLGTIVTYISWMVLSRVHVSFNFLSILICVIILLSLALHEVGYWQFNAIIIRRVLVIPGLLTGYFIDYFSNNEFTYLAYSIFSGVFDYKYDVTPPFVIGEFYFGRNDMSANASYLASAFGDFGYSGCILFTVILAIVYRNLDFWAEKIKATPEVSAIILLPTWALVDSSLITVLFTHGLLIIVLFAFFLPKSFFRVN
ncbi:TPA: hypothetical protein KDZ66_004214 [Vibrio vulnificus]|nr:hypothetical protein [Vibrio vulnificus]